MELTIVAFTVDETGKFVMNCWSGGPKNLSYLVRIFLIEFIGQQSKVKVMFLRVEILYLRYNGDIHLQDFYTTLEKKSYVITL